MAKSAFIQMKKTSLLSDLLAVLIWFPDPSAQVGTASLSFGEAVSKPPASCQQPQLHTSRLTPQVLKHTEASSSTPALHSTWVDSPVRCSGHEVLRWSRNSEKSFVLHADWGPDRILKCPHFKIFISITFKNFFVFITQNTLWFSRYYVNFMDEKLMHGRIGTYCNSSLIQFTLFFLFLKYWAKYNNVMGAGSCGINLWVKL